MSTTNTKLKVRELAEEINWDISRVKSKLREIGVYVNSTETEVSAADIERFKKHIGYVPEEEKKEEDKPSAKTSASSAQEGVIMRTRSDYSGEVPSIGKKQKQTKGGVAGTADSNLRSGYVTVTDDEREQYEAIQRENARAKAATKNADAGAQTPDTAEARTAERPRIRRRAANNGTPANENSGTGAAQNEAVAPQNTTGSAGTAEGTASDRPRVVRRKAATSAEPSNETTKTPSTENGASAPVDESKSPAATGETGTNTAEGTPSATETVKPADASEGTADAGERPETEKQETPKDSDAKEEEAKKAPETSPSGYVPPEITVRPVRVQPIIRRVPQGTAQQGTGTRPNQPNRGDRPQGTRDDQRGDRRPSDGRPQGDRRPVQGGQQGGQRPAAGGRPSPQGVASNQPAVTQRRDSGRDKDSARTEKRNEGTRRAGGPQKAGKYNDARSWIGTRGSVSDVESDEFSINNSYIESGRQGQKNPKAKKKSQADEQARIAAQKLTNVKIPPTITVGAFAALIKKTVSEVITKLFKDGIIASQNQEIDFDTAAIIADSFGITAEPEIIVSNEELLLEDPEDKEPAEDAEPRPPVVVVMGHVDHGKTSLLDAIRNTSVTAGEAGGITQHIGAYTVTINDHKITFLDTPGHEAFTAMRARGAQVTDVAIIVVAADDGVMPQTIEAINHAKAANVSVVVAVNKIDKEGANIDRVKNEMAEQGIVCEEWGGDVPFVPVSAKKGANINELLETVILSADILELKASRTKQCKGTVIEAKLDKNKGPVATLLVQRGTLKTGDAILTETTFGHVRRMTDDKGRTIKEAGPSMPVEVTGLPEVPEAGKVFYCVNKDEHLAKKVAEERIAKNREKTMTYSNKVTLEDLYSQIKAGEVKNLDVIVKADVKGSVEAVKSSLEGIVNDEVRVRVIHSAVGGISESDVLLAEASNAIIIGFNVRPVGNAGEMAAEKHVDVKLYKVIYNAIEDVKAAMKGMLKPEFKETVIGHVEIRKIYKISGVGTVAGGYVLNGKVQRNSEVRIVRDGIVVYEGKLASLKRYQDDVKEVPTSYECGLSFESFNDIKEGDVAECYIMEQVERTI